jgi:hypothetical protein
VAFAAKVRGNGFFAKPAKVGIRVVLSWKTQTPRPLEEAAVFCDRAHQVVSPEIA